MRTNRKLLAVAAGLVCCGVVVLFSTSIRGSQKTYEIHPYVSVPEYGIDTSRTMDAYERLMERYMSLTEKNLDRIGTNLRSVVRKLDSIDAKLTKLSARMAKIEKALDIKQAKHPGGGRPARNSSLPVQSDSGSDKR